MAKDALGEAGQKKVDWVKRHSVVNVWARLW